jgi:hypothetical protein
MRKKPAGFDKYLPARTRLSKSGSAAPEKKPHIKGKKMKMWLMPTVVTLQEIGCELNERNTRQCGWLIQSGQTTRCRNGIQISHATRFLCHQALLGINIPFTSRLLNQEITGAGGVLLVGGPTLTPGGRLCHFMTASPVKPKPFKYQQFNQSVHA